MRAGKTTNRGHRTIAEVEAILAEEKALGADAPYSVLVELQHRKWRLIHKHFHDNPFRVAGTLPRARQWRRVLEHARAEVAEVELVDWLLQQVHIADNLAAGIQDLRPRKNGPTYDVFMEWVANKKRKATAVHQWIAAAKIGGQGAGGRKDGTPEPD